MASSLNKFKVYLEIGKKRTVAGAIDWPGWCRIGRDEASALQALLECAPRYARVVGAASLGFRPPVDARAITVVERLKGNMTTDFGAPAIAPAADARPVTPIELERLKQVLNACWQTFDTAVQAAADKELAKGPRGGGRDLDKIVAHVVGADEAYVGQLGLKIKWAADDARGREQSQTWQAITSALSASARGELPIRGPRGGLRWTPRYYSRRAAWHILDHAWEIEDRAKE